MADFDLYIGYMADFLDSDRPVPLPVLNEKQQADLAAIGQSSDNVLHYVNYSLQLSSSRRFPYYTACNIDGSLFKKAPRKDRWRRDERVSKEQQWGQELYSADKSDFDKGHMTKREDVQWGDSIAFASLAADSTFYYTNAVPQHALLNQRIWRSLEDYILHTEAKDSGLRICVFTGPVLSERDPWFVTRVKEQAIQIPTLFWKVVMFRKSNGKIYRVGFLMSQATLLFEHEIAQEARLERVGPEAEAEEKLFMEFEGAETYQVNVATIEKLTKMKLPAGEEPFKDDRKIPLILDEVDVKESLKETADIYTQMGFRIANLEL